jgi:hypothetical protein
MDFHGGEIPIRQLTLNCLDGDEILAKTTVRDDGIRVRTCGSMTEALRRVIDHPWDQRQQLECFVGDLYTCRQIELGAIGKLERVHHTGLRSLKVDLAFGTHPEEPELLEIVDRFIKENRQFLGHLHQTWALGRLGELWPDRVVPAVRTAKTAKED